MDTDLPRGPHRSVPEVDKLKAKLIAGRIIPAIATATAVATGEHEHISILHGAVFVYEGICSCGMSDCCLLLQENSSLNSRLNRYLLPH